MSSCLKPCFPDWLSGGCPRRGRKPGVSDQEGLQFDRFGRDATRRYKAPFSNVEAALQTQEVFATHEFDLLGGRIGGQRDVSSSTHEAGTRDRNDEPNVNELKVYRGTAWGVPTTLALRADSDRCICMGEGFNQHGPFSLLGDISDDGLMTLTAANSHGLFKLLLRWCASTARLVGSSQATLDVNSPDVCLERVFPVDAQTSEQLLVWSCAATLPRDTPEFAITLVLEHLPSTYSEFGWRSREEMENTFLCAFAENGAGVVGRGLSKKKAEDMHRLLSQIGVDASVHIDVAEASAARLLPPPPSRTRQARARRAAPTFMSWSGTSQEARDAEERAGLLGRADALQNLMGTSKSDCCLQRIRTADSLTKVKEIYDALLVSAKRVAVDSWLSQQLADTKPMSVQEDWECPICLDDDAQDIIGVCKGEDGVGIHCFHKDCIQSWLMRRNDCPCCQRTPLIELLASISEVDNDEMRNF